LVKTTIMSANVNSIQKKKQQHFFQRLGFLEMATFI